MFGSIILDLNFYFDYSATFVYFSYWILYEFAMLLDVYILLSSQEEEVHSFSCGNRCTHGSTFIKNIKPFVIILVCCDNTQKNKTARQIASSLVLLV